MPDSPIEWTIHYQGTKAGVKVDDFKFTAEEGVPRIVSAVAWANGFGGLEADATVTPNYICTQGLKVNDSIKFSLANGTPSTTGADHELNYYSGPEKTAVKQSAYEVSVSGYDVTYTIVKPSEFTNNVEYLFEMYDDTTTDYFPTFKVTQAAVTVTAETTGTWGSVSDDKVENGQ